MDEWIKGDRNDKALVDWVVGEFELSDITMDEKANIAKSEAFTYI